jgi:subtilisin family serine protease
MKSATRTFRHAAPLLASLLLALASPAHAADAEVPGEILVKLRSASALGPLLTKHQLTLAAGFGARPMYRLKVTGNADVHAKIDALRAELDVLIAEPNVVHQSPEARKNHAWAIGTESEYKAQWAPAAMRLAQAQALTTGTGVRVAVLDTGIDRKHPVFAGRLLKGYDFVDGDTDPTEMGSKADAAYGHGTHVAGLIALVAPGAKIMPLRVLDPAGKGDAWVIAQAILYAVDPDGNPATNDGAKVVNLSLGSTSRTEMLDAVVKLSACSIPAVNTPTEDYSDPGYNDDKARCLAFNGTVVVAAAGNDGSKSVKQYPAAEGAYGLFAVTASTADWVLASFANYGSWVDVAAPGEGITSSVPGGGYGVWSGTSMAAPLAAGTAALVRSLKPKMKAVDVAKRIVRASATLCGGAKQRVVDAAAAVTNVVPPDTTCP